MPDIYKLDVKNRTECERLPLRGCLFVAIGSDPSLAEVAIIAGERRPRDLISRLPEVGEVGWFLQRCYEVPTIVWEALSTLTPRFMVDPFDANTMCYAKIPTYNESVLRFIDKALAQSQETAPDIWSTVAGDRELKAAQKNRYLGQREARLPDLVELAIFTNRLIIAKKAPTGVIPTTLAMASLLSIVGIGLADYFMPTAYDDGQRIANKLSDKELRTIKRFVELHESLASDGLLEESVFVPQIEARQNYVTKEGGTKGYISFKLLSSWVDGIVDSERAKCCAVNSRNSSDEDERKAKFMRDFVAGKCPGARTTG